MIKFLHVADLHLDSPFSSLSPQQAAARRAEQREQLASIVELCNDEGCDLLLLAGDLFDSDNAYQDTIDALIRALRGCRAQVLIAPGNHDYFTDASPYATVAWPEHVHIFRTEQITSIVLPKLGCEVYGAAFTAPNAPSLLEGFQVRDEALTNLMVLHGDALTPGSPYNAITREQIAASGLDYLALGHIHALGQPERAGKTVYAWPGCPLGRGFDETGEKGVLLSTIERGRVETRFVPLPGCRYEIFRVAAGDDPLAAVESVLPEDATRLICRVILTGEADAVDTRALYDALSPRCFSLTLRDETVPKRDLWADCEGDTLRALFLQTLKAELEAAPPEERARYIMAAQFGLDVMDGREVPEG